MRQKPVKTGLFRGDFSLVRFFGAFSLRYGTKPVQNGRDWSSQNETRFGAMRYGCSGFAYNFRGALRLVSAEHVTWIERADWLVDA